ncbi:ornithine carbamoyltransferase [Catellatospora sp. TT07R-123]|uniref:ornithine carbamoyltransferase n=1 Tax=Catellatospora sp. TT07R-123 TaxID=2733863 RepID=UPI001B04B2A1|nr:ornithine carbamoyltransferase [Catellatospora sp. TT07R-123]GHJ48849.1 ornithine carbamoyltransferase [Catellatospora sp. TT07R-123]
MKPPVRHLISIEDLTDEDLAAIVARGVQMAAGDHGQPLDGLVAGIYFAKTSTRTRSAFSAGALRLGARLVSYGPGDLQLNTGETSEDTGRVFAGMLDVLVARTAADEAEMRAWACQDRMAVINAMSAQEHPTQALTDLTTLMRRFGRIEGLRLLYVGEGNNTATALALALTRVPGFELELRTPPGYGLPAELLDRARKQAAAYGAVITERHDMDDLPVGVDAIYTTRWQTTGSSKPDPDWREVFAPFQVRPQLWRHSPNALFLHDLPAHRGEEVAAEVLDGPASIAFEQAHNKMYSAMAVLEWSHQVTGRIC